MTTTTTAPRSQWISITTATVLLALNLFVLGPWLTQVAGELPAQLAYVGIRIGAIVALAAALVRWHGRNRFQALAATAFVAFIDHVVFKAGMLAADLRAHPEVWQDTSLGSALLALSMSFMLFSPIILVFAFLGAEGLTLWRLLRGKPRPHGITPCPLSSASSLSRYASQALRYSP